MKIGIVGAGSAGGAFARGWARAGHKVTFGVRDPSSPKLHALVAEIGGNASSGTTPRRPASGR